MNKTQVVVIGGGTGQSVILRGLKNLDNIHLTTIVTVADDGGSTGRLRQYMQIPAMGDVRNVMIALSEEETLLTQLMDYRFEGEEGNEIAGHNLGNLMLTALTQSCGSFMEAIAKISKVLRVRGDIIPATTQIVTLCARMDDGTIVRGESNIPKYFNRIDEVFYQETVNATAQAIDAVMNADIIILGIGSLYTSILPNLIIEDLRKAINVSDAKRIYLCNAMTQHGETDEYSLEEHVAAIEKHLLNNIDLVIRANDKLPQKLLKRYETEYSYPVLMEQKEHAYEVYSASLLTFDRQLIRHDPAKIQQVIADVVQQGSKVCHLPRK